MNMSTFNIYLLNMDWWNSGSFLYLTSFHNTNRQILFLKIFRLDCALQLPEDIFSSHAACVLIFLLTKQSPRKWCSKTDPRRPEKWGSKTDPGCRKSDAAKLISEWQWSDTAKEISLEGRAEKSADDAAITYCT